MPLTNEETIKKDKDENIEKKDNLKEYTQPEETFQSESHPVESEEISSGKLNPSLHNLYFESQEEPKEQTEQKEPKDESKSPKNDNLEEDKKPKLKFKKITQIKKNKKPNDESDNIDRNESPKINMKLQNQDEDLKDGDKSNKLRGKKIIRRDVDDSQKDENADEPKEHLTDIATIIDNEKNENEEMPPESYKKLIKLITRGLGLMQIHFDNLGKKKKNKKRRKSKKDEAQSNDDLPKVEETYGTVLPDDNIDKNEDEQNKNKNDKEEIITKGVLLPDTDEKD